MTGLLSPFATFLLGLAAVLRVANYFPISINKLRRQYASETGYEEDDESNRDVIMSWLMSIQQKLVNWLFCFIIDPLLVVIAITRNIGYQPVAWFMIGIVALSAYLWARYVDIAIKVHTNKPVERVEMEHAVPYKWVQLADSLKISHSVRYVLRQFVNYLPDLYCWYLLMVVLGVLR